MFLNRNEITDKKRTPTQIKERTFTLFTTGNFTTID